MKVEYKRTIMDLTMEDRRRPGFTLWLTGLSGSGKTTLARTVSAQLAQRGCAVEVLDGDEIRSSISADLGYSKRDRDANIKRIGFMARLLSRNGIGVVVAAISPYRAARAQVRDAHETPFVEVFVDCSLPELERRDTKGLYKRALSGELQDFTGVSAPYEPPEHPEIHVRTHQADVQTCTGLIVTELERLGVLSA
jgi:adenylylsulfate kinase